ncbi:MAG TPA: hypothetical protein VHP38_01580 [Ruminiclostridium sp.]|nr:hypothetical protein [Ruminiclostridium sp.]
MSLIHKRQQRSEPDNKETVISQKTSEKSPAHINFRDYAGQTVTVFVNSGGMAGNGFTGILIQNSDTCIKLLIIPSVPPACSLGNACSGKKINPLFCCLCPYNRTVGSIAEIPIASVTAFVHNTVNKI